MQGDVSFTFLDRIEEVELNIVDRRWQSALALALTLPDICGGIAFPRKMHDHLQRLEAGQAGLLCSPHQECQKQKNGQKRHHQSRMPH